MSTETNRDDGDPAHRAGVLPEMRESDNSRPRLHRLQWLGYGLAALNAVVIACLVFDIPLGEAAKKLPVRLISVAATITDVGRLVSLLAVLSVILAVGLLIAVRQSGSRRRFRLIRLWRSAAYVLASLLSVSAIVNILKYVIGRARPPLYEQFGVLGFAPFHGGYLFESFPSAHSANAGAVFMALTLLFPRFRLLFASMALWLGMTRIIVGAHYPSDVIAGLVLGAGCAIAAAFLFARVGWIFVITSDGWPRLRNGPIQSAPARHNGVKK